MKVLWVLALALLLPVATESADTKVISLKDDLRFGCAREFSMNRAIPAVRFRFNDRAPLEIQAAPAERWIKLFDEKRMLGGAFSRKPIVELKKDKKNLREVVLRFELGCMFVDGKTITVYDWEAVKKWEAKGGYKKLGLPMKDDFKAKVRIDRAKPAIAT